MVREYAWCAVRGWMSFVADLDAFWLLRHRAPQVVLDTGAIAWTS
jgi:hypothetical protein